jgi:hypothetical protein
MRTAMRMMVDMSKRTTYQVDESIDESNPNRIRIKVPADVFDAADRVMGEQGRVAAGQLAINRLRAGRS